MINLPLSRLNNHELFTLSKRIHELITEYNTAELGIKPYADNFAEKFSVYSVSFEKQSVDAKSIAEKDGVRDRYFIAFRTHVQNFSYHPDAALREKSDAIVKILNRDGVRVYRENYKKQSASLESMLTELEKNNLSAIQEMGAKVWFDLLKQAQTDFESNLKGITEQKAENNQIASASEVRHELVEALRKLLTFLPLHNEMLQSAVLGDLISNIQVIADRFN